MQYMHETPTTLRRRQKNICIRTFFKFCTTSSFSPNSSLVVTRGDLKSKELSTVIQSYPDCSLNGRHAIGKTDSQAVTCDTRQQLGGVEQLLGVNTVAARPIV